MKFLHTSDWHLGRTLYGRKRYEEFAEFLDWLALLTEREQVDALLIAGDVFDTTTPSNQAQELYYRFLCRVAGSCCRQVIITAGNHDSASFLEAPKELLRSLHVHVIGRVREKPEDELVVVEKLGGKEGEREIAIVCAVPYLRDRDIRSVEAGESSQEKDRKLIDAIALHYREVVAAALEARDEFLQEGVSMVPLLAMGHLFAAGGKTMEGDGVRELYVGSLAMVESGLFPDEIDYLALGHLHVPQKIGGCEHRRYSGSPLPMGFGEAKQEKSVVLVQFSCNKDEACGAEPVCIPIPSFQQLTRISGSLEDIIRSIELLKKEESSAWLEIEYNGTALVPDLREQIEEAVTESKLEVRRVRNRLLVEKVLAKTMEEEYLDDLDVNEVFERCLAVYDVEDKERVELLATYGEVVRDLLEEGEENEDS